METSSMRSTAHETSAGLDGLPPGHLELLLTLRNVCLNKRPEYVCGSKDNMVIFSKTQKIMEVWWNKS